MPDVTPPEPRAVSGDSTPDSPDPGESSLGRPRWGAAHVLASLLALAALAAAGCSASIKDLQGSTGTDADVPRYPGGIKMAFGPYPIPASSDAIWGLKTTLNTFHAFFDANAVRLAMNPGACNAWVLARIDTLRPADSLTVDLSEPDWSIWYPLFVAGQDTLTWELPSHTALHIGYHPGLDVRAHYLSVANAPVIGERVKFAATVRRFDEPDAPGYLVGTLVAERHDFLLPPHQTTTLIQDVAVPYATKLLGLLGEYHRWGTGMTVDVLDHSGAQLARVYQATGVRPSFRSLSDPVQVPEGGIIRITATYKNDTDATILPGPKWDGQEAFRLIAFHSGKPQPAEIAHWVFQR